MSQKGFLSISSTFAIYITAMKLTVKSVRGHGARLCSLTEVGRHGNKSLETPMCLLYTRGGLFSFFLTCLM